MTRQKSFKRLVRTRMEKTGESYTAARAALLGADEPKNGAGPWLATGDASIRERTGRGWEEWFDRLDEWGAGERTHRDIARWIAEQLGIDPLAWNAQAITMSYERTRGMREPGEHADGFTITASKTVAVPVERLYDAVVDAGERARWLPDAALRERTATRPRSARFDWGEDGSRVVATFAAKDAGRSTVSFSHERLAGADERDRMKAYWRERVTALKAVLEA
jgi:hypothetical protein